MIENTDAAQIERLNSRVVELLRERDALVKALTGVRFIGEDPIGLTERKQIQKICNAALASIKETAP